MKELKIILFFIGISVLFFNACSSSQNTAGKTKKTPAKVVDDGYKQSLDKNSNHANFEVRPNDERKSNLSLGDMIRRLPGVQVGGSGNNLIVKINGSESFMADTRPLYVVNGTAIGNDFSQVASAVNPNDVDSIRVLKGSDATIYGTRGSNGVILIRTKK